MELSKISQLEALLSYGDPREPDDVCIECETCCCVLISCEDFEEDIHDGCCTKDEVSKL